MSTLSNPTEEIMTEDQAKQLLLKMVLEPTKKVTQSDLRETGVDIDMLEKTYEEGIRPYLDYLHGYRPLREQDPLEGKRQKGHWDPVQQRHRIDAYPHSWRDRLEHADIESVELQSILLVDVELYAVGERHQRQGSTRRYLRVFLTRSGRWVTWTATAGRADYLRMNEQVYQYAGPRAMWEGMHEWGVEDYSLQPMYYVHQGMPETLPLYIESQLRRILEGTIDIRRGRLNKLEAALGVATERFSRVNLRR